MRTVVNRSISSARPPGVAVLHTCAYACITQYCFPSGCMRHGGSHATARIGVFSHTTHINACQRRFAASASASAADKGSSSSSAKNNNTKGDFSASCPHKVMGIPKSASLSLVREAYLAHCKAHHPDVGGCETVFKKIQWAYEECKLYCQTASSGVGDGDDNDASNGDDDADDTNGESRSYRSEEDRQRRADARRAWQAAQKELDDAELRAEFRAQFEKASDVALIDALLEEALTCGCFAHKDVSEPLMMALQRYHFGIDFGAAHADKCFEAMDTWERLAGRSVHAMFFHTLLTLYSNQAFAHTSDSMTVSETVNTIMDRMADKGLPHDDWTIMIANRVFRAVPYPDW